MMMKIYANWWKKTVLTTFNRANIIETLLDIYIVEKQVLPTPTGIQLIDTIQNDLVKSAELTGSWENS
jgi:DNA topoisomerase IA